MQPQRNILAPRAPLELEIESESSSVCSACSLFNSLLSVSLSLSLDVCLTISLLKGLVVSWTDLELNINKSVNGGPHVFSESYLRITALCTKE